MVGGEAEAVGESAQRGGGVDALGYEERPELHGPGWEGVRKGIDSEQGWTLYLRRYGELLGTAG
jgi:hypothetical protein